jgi:hypothetical protein
LFHPEVSFRPDLVGQFHFLNLAALLPREGNETQWGRDRLKNGSEMVFG